MPPCTVTRPTPSISRQLRLQQRVGGVADTVDRDACRRSAPASGSARRPGSPWRRPADRAASTGSVPAAALIAACTSCAALSMLRSRSNCSVIWLVPSELAEVIVVRPGIWPNWRSSEAVIRVATVSGLAPGSWVVTRMVGKSTSRQRRDRQRAVAEHAGQQDGERQQPGGDRPGDERGGDVHAAAGQAAVCAAAARVSGRGARPALAAGGVPAAAARCDPGAVGQPGGAVDHHALARLQAGGR